MSLEGKVALITGASRGIGLEIARVLADRGMAVAMNARSDLVVGHADALRAEGRRALPIIADISRKAEVEAMMDRVEAELGPLWLLVNNAGALRTGPTADMAKKPGTRSLRWMPRGFSLFSGGYPAHDPAASGPDRQHLFDCRRYRPGGADRLLFG